MHYFHGKFEARMQDQRSLCEFLTRWIERRNFVPSSGISLGSPLDKSCLAFVQSPESGDWIEFWSISGESMHMKSVLKVEKALNDLTPMDAPSIPEKHHRSLQMAQQVAEKSDNFLTCNVGGMKLDIETDTTSPTHTTTSSPTSLPMSNANISQRKVEMLSISDLMEIFHLKSRSACIEFVKLLATEHIISTIVKESHSIQVPAQGIYAFLTKYISLADAVKKFGHGAKLRYAVASTKEIKSRQIGKQYFLEKASLVIWMKKHGIPHESLF